ncbi:probable G-protein coupled receptor 148 [Protopterus annectens]|uniref:probable G-protein coupled receptor 148 n=1 Tax=Protopterus annectens TaxID=7888 RepID=UPI001CFBA18C|nr:probable G-protein coupled receptor 148 [Protopterus annectens]
MNESSCGMFRFLRLVNASVDLQKSINSSNASLYLTDSDKVILREWVIYPPYWPMKILLIAPVLCTCAASIAIPLILVAIFSNHSLRQETRFLLLGNALLCDLMYLVLYTLSAIFNAAHLVFNNVGCIIHLYLLAAMYSGGIITAVLMVINTYLAVLWPLHYFTFLTFSRTKKLITLIWVTALVIPTGLFVVMELTSHQLPCPINTCSLPIIMVLTLNGNDAVKFTYLLSLAGVLICLSLIFCCYTMLYFKTKESGICKGFMSRASVTFLMHYALLFFYFCPLLVLVMETLLYVNNVIGLKTGLWVTLAVCNILMVIPKVLTPYMYGMRYRELSNSVKLLFKTKCVHTDSPVS